MVKVMRLGPGREVELFDGLGQVCEAVIETIEPGQAVLRVMELKPANKPAGQQITIAASVAKGDRFDLLISKCTELGVDRICPTIFQRTVKQPGNPKICRRYENLALAAAKQSGRILLPEIDAPASLSQVLERCCCNDNDSDTDGKSAQRQIIMGSLRADAASLFEYLPFKDDVWAFVGPEGGLTETEEQLLHDYGALEVRLTATTLRIETAAIVLAGVLAANRDAATEKSI
jgi:16S rRNA (uracil1498-N3)-methyltransferase